MNLQRLNRLWLTLPLAALLLWGALSWWSDDVRKIHREIARIQKLVQRGSGERDLEGLDKARRIAAVFTPGFEVHVPQYGVVTTDRRTLIAAIHRYRSSTGPLSMRVSDKEISVDSALGRATANLTAEFATGLGGIGSRDVFRFQVNFRETESGWRIDYLTLTEILESSGRIG